MKVTIVMACVLCCIIAFSAAFDTENFQSEKECSAFTFNHEGHISSKLPVVANDASSSPEPWHLSRIKAPQAWQITAGESDILIAILDTGIDQTHRDLSGKVVATINFTHSSKVTDLHGHGTHIAGTIAANTDNVIGSTGVAHNCSLMNVKVAEDDGFCDSGTVAKGIIWAVDNGANVINISLTITKPSPILEEALNYAWDKGTIIVAAAGNNYSATPSYPAAYPNVIGVAATDKDDRLPQWSNHGEWVSLGSPGVDIYSTLPNDNYGYESGTSSAAALVSGEAALLLTVVTDDNGNGYINDEVRHVIESTCDELQTAGLGKGRINILKAARAT